MATTKNGWTMTHDGTTGNYTLEKSVTTNGDQTILVKCGNKNMTGDVRVNVGVSVPTGITPTGTITLTQQTGTNVTNYASANVRSATYGATLSQTLSGTKITITPSVSVSQSGWVESGKTGTSVVINATDFGTGVVTPTVDSLSSPTVAVSGAASGMVTTTSGTYYVEVTGTGTNGSVKAKETRSAGYVSAGNSSSAATTITPNITGSGSKVYIQAGALGAGVSGNITFTPSVATNMATITKPSSGTEGTDYFSITGSGTKSGSVSGTANISTEGYVKNETASGGSATGSISADAKKYISKATITNNTSGGTSSGTINRGSQIKIAQGYNPSTVYYQAQSNSGAVSITQQNGQSVDGYATANVQSSTISNPVATKGAVSSNQVVITPSVEITGAGWVATGTLTGSSIVVKASDLVSGTTTPTSSGTKDCKTYASVTIRNATISMPSSLSGTDASASLSGTTITLTKASVTNTASVSQTGWITSLSGNTNLSLSGTVPTQTKTCTPSASSQDITPDDGYLLSKVTVEAAPVPTYKDVEITTASSTQIYKIRGSVTIFAKNVGVGTGTTISDTYFKITSIVTSYASSIYTTTITYQTMNNRTYSSNTTSEADISPDWTSSTVTVQGTNGSGSCVLRYNIGEGILAKCSSTATTKLSKTSTSATPNTHQVPMGNDDLYWYMINLKATRTQTRYSHYILFYPFMSLHSSSIATGSSTSAASSSVGYAYSTDGSTISTASASCSSGDGSSSSSSRSGYSYVYLKYYPTTEFL